LFISLELFFGDICNICIQEACVRRVSGERYSRSTACEVPSKQHCQNKLFSHKSWKYLVLRGG